VITSGLASIGQPELRAVVNEETSIEEARVLLQRIAGYIVSVNRGFRPGDDLRVDGRLIRFGAVVDGVVELSVFANPAFDIAAREDTVD
jgi:hypothetical protein